MTDRDAVNLTRIMRDDGILRISALEGGCFALYMKGGICGTGKSVGEAYESALSDRHARDMEGAA